MRPALRALAVVAALIVAGVVALGVLLPRLVDRPEVRSRIEAAAREATGREISYESLRAAVFPPAIEVVHPVLAGEAAGEPPLFEADRVALRLELLPLLSRSVVIESLRVDGAKARVIRSPSAPVTPAAPAESVAPTASTSPVAPTAPATPVEREVPATPVTPDTAAAQAQPPTPPFGIPLGIRAIDVEDATLSIEDRSVSPPVLLVLDDVDAKARATGPEAPVRFEATLRVESGGSIVVQGTATTAGEIEAEATLKGVEAKPFTAYLDAGHARGKGRAIAGRLGGTVHASGPAAALSKIDAKLRFEEAAIDLESVRLRGSLSLSANLANVEGALGGPFEIDATDADLAYGGAFHKPPGTAATLSGVLSTRPGGGFDVDALRVKIKNFEAHGSLQSQPRPELTLTAPPFDLAGWEALLPAMAGTALAGLLGLDARVASVGDASVGTLAVTGRGIDAHALSPRISGPLRFDAHLQAPLGAARPLADVVTGTLDFALGPGTIEGVSMLRDTLERSGPVVQAAVAAGKAFGGRDVQRMYGDRFESISGLVKLAAGTARFDPIEAVYRDHRVDLRGSVRLADRALDATGRIEFADARGAGAMRGQTLPISHIGGTLDRPRVDLSPEDVALVVSRASGSVLERKLEPLLDRLRGEGGAKSPLGALQNLLQGRKRD